MMDWNLAAEISQVVSAPITALGLLGIAVELVLNRRQTRLQALDLLYSQLDTHEARLAREFIYQAQPQQLTFTYLHEPSHAEARKQVEETIATLERFAYRITTHQIPHQDAFNLYGGVLLAVALRLWPYVEEQRAMRQRNSASHKLEYRRYLEVVARDWVRRYARATGQRPPSRNLKTLDQLRAIFPPAGGA